MDLTTIRFQCQGSGNCCISRGSYGFVYLTFKDRQRFANHFKISTKEFTEKYCGETDGYKHLKEDPNRAECMFLKDNRCSVYKARPTQCRTWPFWPENMTAKKWKTEVATFCPGVGKGEVVPLERIEQLVSEQEESERQL